MKLFLNALIKFICGVILLCALIFLPAGTFNYFGGWLFCAVLFIPVLLMGIVLKIKAPALLEKRLNRKEKEDTQKGVIALSALMFIVGFVISGLDFRFAWSFVPNWASITAAVLFLIGYGIFAEVMRENEYLSRAVEVFEGQKVVDTGLYGIVRHPMYFATLLMFLSMPVILGSWYSFVVFLAYPIIIVIRIINEEKVLTKNLDGYAQYKEKVKFRLIPFVW